MKKRKVILWSFVFMLIVGVGIVGFTAMSNADGLSNIPRTRSYYETRLMTSERITGFMRT